MIMESTNEKTLFEVSEIQPSYKSKVKASLRPKISSSRDGRTSSSSGGIAGTVADPKLIFACALKGA
jgi:DNA repair protein RadC